MTTICPNFRCEICKYMDTKGNNVTCYLSKAIIPDVSKRPPWCELRQTEHVANFVAEFMTDINKEVLGEDTKLTENTDSIIAKFKKHELLQKLGRNYCHKMGIVIPTLFKE